MKKAILFLVICFISITLQAQQPPAFQDTIPFRNDLGIIIIPMTFNGVEKQFAFDTGAQVTVGFSWVDRDLKPTSKTVTVNSSNGSKTRMRYYKSGNIQLGSRKITKHRILKTTDSDIFSCYQVDGVLGVDITQHFNWIIDFEKKILIMSPPDFYPEDVKEMHALDFDFAKNRPSVFMEMNGKKIKFLLDTGARDSDINKDAYTLLSMDEYPKATFYSGFYDVNGTLTKTYSKTLQLPEIKSGTVTIAPDVDYSTQSTKIGNSLWKDRRLFLSLKNDQLFVSDATIKNEAWSYDGAAVLKNGKMTVYRIREGSDAWEQGIRQGDEIKTFNGNVFTDFCELDKFQRQLSDEKSDFEWEFTNGKKLTIQRKKLFVL
ncbi:pepsin/retropepsin-like aspartic protease family protein [uncultured Dokdonia sp.]|uniref:pepsin/retropepsin-like aspartic protease family protein n=1 Tax=uncultured Dokdonia sp. TaxID=575653 RepID=UPI00260FCFDA|nr:pepsin/retropepsin-like aspartic protease family protein [uncultured Dokdonia sp.]